MEMICIQLHLNFQKDILILGVYRPPSSGMIFFDRLNEMLEVIHSSSSGNHET